MTELPSSDESAAEYRERIAAWLDRCAMENAALWGRAVGSPLEQYYRGGMNESSLNATALRDGSWELEL